MSLLRFAHVRPILARLHGPTNVKENIRLSVYISRYLQQDYLSTTVLRSAKTFGPGDVQKGFKMKKKIKDPKELVNSLLDPLIKTGDTVEPMMVYRRNYIDGKPYWNACLHIYWPHNICLSAMHRSLQTAEEDVYFKACEVYQKMGLIHESDGQVRSVNEEKVFDVLHTMYEKGTYVDNDISSKHNFRLFTTKSKKDNQYMWNSEINVPWPFSFSVSSSGYSFYSTQYMTCLLAYTRFKILGLLNESNNLAVHKLPRIRKSKIPEENREVTREAFGPQYEVYVDASQSGLGAYLLTREKNDTIHWISEGWPDHFEPSEFTEDFTRKFDSCYYEYYALVTAVYTWKQKFINKKVLCWSDNKSAVDFTNHGLRPGDKTLQKYGRLYQIMIQTCAKYNIDLRALHVKRVHNQKADLLSKLRISEFKKMSPCAEPWSKKSKKLLFWKPLVDSDPKPPGKPDPKTPGKPDPKNPGKPDPDSKE